MPGSWADNFRNPAALARFLLVTTVGVTLDLWTKSLAEAHLRHADAIRFIPGWLHFTYTENRGAVFGIGQGQRSLFLVVSVLAIGFLSYLFATSGKQRFYQFVLGMLLAGVLGNLYDRYHYGYVRDMIHALPGWTWPGTRAEIFPWIFNVADCLLCVGVFFMIVYSFFFAPRIADEPAPATKSDESARA